MILLKDGFEAEEDEVFLFDECVPLIVRIVRPMSL